MSAPAPIDAVRLGLMLNELRLPTIKTVWADFAARADKEGWPAARFLAAMAEHELAERDRRRIERHLTEARLPPGKTLDSFDFDAVPMISKAQVMAVAAGDAWLNTGANLLLFGPPGGGKSHLAAAIGLALVENGWKVLFTRNPRRRLAQPGQAALADVRLLGQERVETSARLGRQKRGNVGDDFAVGGVHGRGRHALDDADAGYDDMSAPHLIEESAEKRVSIGHAERLHFEPG